MPLANLFRAVNFQFGETVMLDGVETTATVYRSSTPENARIGGVTSADFSSTQLVLKGGTVDVDNTRYIIDRVVAKSSAVVSALLRLK